MSYNLGFASSKLINRVMEHVIPMLTEACDDVLTAPLPSFEITDADRIISGWVRGKGWWIEWMCDIITGNKTGEWYECVPVMAIWSKIGKTDSYDKVVLTHHDVYEKHFEEHAKEVADKVMAVVRDCQNIGFQTGSCVP